MSKKEKSPEMLDYKKTLRLLQIELVKLQKQVIAANEKILVIVEGRENGGCPLPAIAGMPQLRRLTRRADPNVPGTEPSADFPDGWTGAVSRPLRRPAKLSRLRLKRPV